MRAVALALLFLLAACQEEPSKFLTRQALASVGRIELVIVLPLRGTGITLAPFNHAFQSEMDRRRQLAAQVDWTMRSVDFRSSLAAAVTQRLATLRSVSVAFERRVITVPSTAGMNEAFDRSMADAVLFLDVIRYIDGSGLTLKGEAQLFPRADRLKRFRPQPDESNPTAPGNAIFRQTLHRVVPAATIDYGQPGQLEAAIAEALDNLALQLATLLDHGT
ncbi:hypothetical protein [Reyranella sp.]|uniref:hypothetical protein n=1 Tax=Reyranella sp. TaxID=1929291 RepID=UPI003BAC3504